MVTKIFVTRKIPDAGIEMLKAPGYEVKVSDKDGVLTKDELIAELKTGEYNAVLCLLTDKIDTEVLDAAGPKCKIFANYAVGYDNIDVEEARKRDIFVSNTPGVLTETVAEYTISLMLSLVRRIPEADKFVRAGEYHGWAPMLLMGSGLAGKTLGVVGLGRIGARVAHHAVRGFDMKVIYYDVNRNADFEKEYNAGYRADVDHVLTDADFVSIHVPLLDSTKHLINDARLQLMKNSAYLINTSRGPVVEEAALGRALKAGTIRGAAIDVFEFEPKIDSLLTELDNIVLTPHIASATEETRGKMSELAAQNILEALSGNIPPNVIQAQG
ncbi:MAG: D-glycerate dehydrogenase [bacterium]|nr:D-glycerate dehydrogenase [bacterium]